MKQMSLLEQLKKETEQAMAAKQSGTALKEPPALPTEAPATAPSSPPALASVPVPAQTPSATASSYYDSADLDEDSVPSLVGDIFDHAIAQHASDIHFKPTEEELQIFFRIDGSMSPYKNFEKIYHHPIIARIKILSGLRIDEHRLPQDGKSSYQSVKGGDEVDLRVSVLPTQYGEKVVIRILEKNPKMVELRDLGMLPNILIKLEKHLKSTYGMILAVGPTGSGKTTTLFSMVSQFDASEYNICTLEDPIEYKIHNVTQTQINSEIHFDFSDGLRTLVRQDPDIIMVGEIRDQKTAALAIESALTGHLVFSTLHTNTAVGTIQRLLNMGIDRFLITASVKLVISQRLARKVCSVCREPYEVPEKYHELLKSEVNVDPKSAYFYRAVGCSECNNTGHNGRIGLFEVLEMSPSIEELIIKNASSTDIEKQAVKEGMILLQKDALYKVITGDVTIEEALRVMA